jgi:transcriptional regulator with XRE-family HTH domain
MVFVSDMDDVLTQSTIGERIRRLRTGALMTQDDLAAAAGVSTDPIRKLEQGRRHTASIGSLHRIAAALDVDLGERHCCIEAKGVIAAHQNGEPGPQARWKTMTNRASEGLLRGF